MIGQFLYVIVLLAVLQVAEEAFRRSDAYVQEGDNSIQGKARQGNKHHFK